jgi:glycosyl transferase family 25
MNTIDHIFYINLDHRTDRREQIEKELEGLGVPVERFPAIKHKWGAIGCSKSHLAVARLAKERGYKRFAVFEDDFQLIVSKEECKKLMEQCITDVPNFDVIMLTITNPIVIPFNNLLHRVMRGQTMSGYIINESYIDTHLGLLERSSYMYEETGEDQYCCDVYWHRVMPDYSFYCFNKHIAIQRPSYSDITKKEEDYFGVIGKSTL